MACCATCKCGRVEGVGGVWGSIGTGIGTAVKTVAPIILPPLIGIGATWIAGRLPGARGPAATAPGPLATPVAEQEATRDKDRTALYVGIGAAALVLFALVATRKR